MGYHDLSGTTVDRYGIERNQQDMASVKSNPALSGGPIFERFGIRSVPKVGHVAPTDWIDGGFIPRGNAMFIATASSQGKSTAIIQSMISASSVGVWKLFGTRTYDKPLRCVLIMGEETESLFARKVAYDGGGSGHAMAVKAFESGNFVAISVRDIARKTGFPDRIFGQDGYLTDLGKQIIKEIIDFRPDVVGFDTLRSCSVADYNNEASVSATISELDDLAETCNCAVIMTTHFSKEAMAKGKITTKSSPLSLLNGIRGSAQLTERMRHTVGLFEDSEGIYDKLPGVAEGDKVYVLASMSNLPGYKYDRSVMPCVRSSEGQTFTTHVDGRTLFDIAVQDRKYTFKRLLEVFPKLIFSSAISGKPLTMTGAYSPEKLSESTLRNLLPEGTTPEMVSAAIKTLLASHEIVQVKTTEKGAPNRYDSHVGPYATADREGAEPPASRGAPDTELLTYAASDEARTFQDILDHARNRGAIAEGVEDLCKLEAGDQPVPEVIVHDEGTATDDIPGMDYMPETPDGDWEQHDPHYSDDAETPPTDISGDIENALADVKSFEI